MTTDLVADIALGLTHWAGCSPEALCVRCRLEELCTRTSRLHGPMPGAHRWVWLAMWVRPHDRKRVLAQRCVACGDTKSGSAYWTKGEGEPRAFAGRCKGPEPSEAGA